MKRNYKILEGGVQPLGQLSDADINILYNQYIKLDGKHKNFKGTKREYCSTVAGLIDKFLKGSNSTLEGSGKLEKSIDFYKPRVLKLLPQADRIAANAAIETIENDATLSKYAQRANIIRLLKIAYQNKPAVDATGKLVPDIKNLNANLDKLLSDLNKKENLISGTVSNLIKFNVLKDAAGNVVKDAAGNPVSAKTITIPKVKHNNKTGIYKTADIPQVISEKIFNKSATDKATDVTLPRLLAYASEFKNVIKAFANNDLATTNFLLAVQYTKLTDITNEGYLERRDFAEKMGLYGQSQTKGDWTEVDEAAFRTEYLVYKQLMANQSLIPDWEKLTKVEYVQDPVTGVSTKRVLSEKELRFVLLGKLFSKELGFQILDFPFDKVLIELKGKKLLKYTTKGKHGGIQVDCKKIGQLVLESFRDDKGYTIKDVKDAAGNVVRDPPVVKKDAAGNVVKDAAGNPVYVPGQKLKRIQYVRDFPTQAKCFFIEYTGDRQLLKFELDEAGNPIAGSKFNVEAIVEFDVTQMLLNPKSRGYLESIKSQIERFCDPATTSKMRGSIANEKEVEDAIFTMMRTYFSVDTIIPATPLTPETLKYNFEPLAISKIGNVKQGEKAANKRKSKDDTKDLTISIDIARREFHNKKLTIAAYSPTFFKPIIDALPTAAEKINYKPSIKDYSELWSNDNEAIVESREQFAVEGGELLITNPEYTLKENLEYREIADPSEDTIAYSTLAEKKSADIKKETKEKPGFYMKELQTPLRSMFDFLSIKNPAAFNPALLNITGKIKVDDLKEAIKQYYRVTGDDVPENIEEFNTLKKNEMKVFVTAFNKASSDYERTNPRQPKIPQYDVSDSQLQLSYESALKIIPPGSRPKPVITPDILVDSIAELSLANPGQPFLLPKSLPNIVATLVPPTGTLAAAAGTTGIPPPIAAAPPVAPPVALGAVLSASTPFEEELKRLAPVSAEHYKTKAAWLSAYLTNAAPAAANTVPTTISELNADYKREFPRRDPAYEPTADQLQAAEDRLFPTFKGYGKPHNERKLKAYNKKVIKYY